MASGPSPEVSRPTQNQWPTCALLLPPSTPVGMRRGDGWSSGVFRILGQLRKLDPHRSRQRCADGICPHSQRGPACFPRPDGVSRTDDRQDRYHRCLYRVPPAFRGSTRRPGSGPGTVHAGSGYRARLTRDATLKADSRFYRRNCPSDREKNPSDYGLQLVEPRCPESSDHQQADDDQRNPAGDVDGADVTFEECHRSAYPSEPQGDK